MRKLAAASVLALSAVVAARADDKKDPGAALTWPTADKYDYRPAKPNFDEEAAKDLPPPWFAIVRPTMLWGMHTTNTGQELDVSLQGICAAWKKADAAKRKKELTEAWEARHSVWEAEKASGVAALASAYPVPRNVTTEEVMAEEPPAWTKTLHHYHLDARHWFKPGKHSLDHRMGYGENRRKAEEAAVGEFLDKWGDAHKDDFAKRRAALVEGAKTIKYVDYYNEPKKYLGQAVRMTVRIGKSGSDVDPRIGATIGEQALALGFGKPPKGDAPTLGGLPKSDYEARQKFYDGLTQGATADIVLLVTNEIPTLGEGAWPEFGGYILEIKIK